MQYVFAAFAGFCLTPILCFASPASGPDAPSRSESGKPAKIVSPEILPDQRATFRFAAPNAKEVALFSPDLATTRTLMAKGADGLWSATVGPLGPDVYTYQFIVDGVRLTDPNNPLRKTMQANTQSLALVPGAAPMLFEEQNVPRGAVTIHAYESKTLGRTRGLYVYTPPDYLTSGAEKYPILYLLHGSGDDESAWTMVGRANVILDNLIAQKKVRPMIVAMFNGHALPPGVRPAEGERDKAGIDLVEDVLPFVESRYRVIGDCEHRAVAGLSMGGAQAMRVGLNNLDKFAWIGCFSGVIDIKNSKQPLPTGLADPGAVNRALRLFWMASGRDDRWVGEQRAFSQYLDDHGIKHVVKETEGKHAWPVWRRYLAEFAPLLFSE